SRTFDVFLNDDDIDEYDETINLTLSSPSQALIGNQTEATLLIVDEDPVPSVQFNQTNYFVIEAGGTWVIPVILSGVSEKSVTVNFATSDGLATAGSDYIAISGTLTLADGQDRMSFTVTILDDNIQEPNETIVLTLDNPSNAILGIRREATLTIVDHNYPVYIPFLAKEFSFFGEHNDSCSTAYQIQANETNVFLPEDVDDWYQFDLTGSGNLIIELTNFVPLRGQLTVWKGASCSEAAENRPLGSNGETSSTKILDPIGTQDSGHYYLYVSNDGLLNYSDLYRLLIKFP
ncbi:MAG: Calx-beta domain-containing protein, partial [Candidatus Promineifilaceae bacterium]